MKEQDVRIDMKVVPHSKTTGMEFQECPAWNTAKYINQPYLYVIEKNFRNEGKSLLCVSKAGGLGSFYNHTDFEPYIDIPDTADALNRALREEISNAFEEFRVSGTPYSSFTIFEAGYRAGMKRGDK